MAELDARVGRGEAPADGGGGAVALLLPGRHLGAHGLLIRHPPIQTLAAQGAEFDLGAVGPTTVFGRVVDLPLVQQPLGLGRREGLVQGGRGVRVEVVQDQDDALGLRLAHIDEVLDLVGPVEPGAPRGEGGPARAR